MDTAVSRLLEDEDPNSRKAKLREMVVGGALTLDELRFLKQLLRDFTFQTDIISRVPLELFTIVVGNLSLRDLWTCYAVSQPWRARLMAEPVAFVLAGIHFPALVENPGERAQGHGIGTQFWETLRNSIRLTEAPARSKLAKSFRWQDETLFTIDNPAVYQGVQLVQLDSLSSNTQLLYSHGRIAWMPEDFTVCVDSLVTLKRKAFSYPEGKLLGLADGISLVGLGSKLVVATMGRMIITWDLETGQREHASLPVLICGCTVEGDQVVFAVRSQVFIYRHGGEYACNTYFRACKTRHATGATFSCSGLLIPKRYSGALLELAISSIPRQHRPNSQQIFSDAIIHPSNGNTIFIAATTDTPRHIVIHEFTDRKWTKSYEHRMHGQRKSNVHLQKANSHGLYAVCESWIYNIREVPAEACRHSREIRDGKLTTCATYFNIHHRTFSRQYFQTPEPQFCSYFWNGCVIKVYWQDPSLVVVHQSSLEHHARKLHWEEYEADLDGGMPEVVGADDSFLVVANTRGYMAWGF